MANPTIQKAVLQVKSNGVMAPYYLENHAAYVKYSKVVEGAQTETTVDAVLEELLAHAAGAVTMDDVNSAVQTAVDGIIDGAPEAYNTLKELATWTTEHQDLYTTLVGAVANKVEKEEGKGLSTNDYTTAEKNKLAAIDVTNGNFALSAEQVAKLDSIDVTNGTFCVSATQIATWSAAAHITVGATAPDNMKDGDLFLQVI